MSHPWQTHGEGQHRARVPDRSHLAVVWGPRRPRHFLSWVVRLEWAAVHIPLFQGAGGDTALHGLLKPSPFPASCSHTGASPPSLSSAFV